MDSVKRPVVIVDANEVFHAGDAVSENNRRAKFYRLTKVGRKQLERENQGWEQMCLAIRRVLQAT